MDVQLSFPLNEQPPVSRPLSIPQATEASLYDEAAHIFCDVLQMIRRTPEGCTAFYRHSIPATSYSRRLASAIGRELTKTFPCFIMQEGSNGYVIFRPVGMKFTEIEKAFPR